MYSDGCLLLTAQQQCIEELRCKAKHFEKTGLIFTLNSSRASDAESNEVNTVIKSDSLVDEELRQAFIAAFEKLRAEQGDNPDWHPDTNEMVQDLVHPSLYPFAYGMLNSSLLPMVLFD